MLFRSDDADSQSTDDEEDHESSIDHLESALDVRAWTNSLRRDDGDVLWSDDGEDGGMEGREETLESTERAVGDVLLEGLAVVEVAEAVDIVLRVSSHHGDEGEEEEGEDEDDFAS